MGPYVGISGIMSPQEVIPLLECVPHGSERKLSIGVLVGTETLNPSQYRARELYPPAEGIKSIFSSDPRALNVLHLSTLDPEGLLLEIDAAVHYGLPFYHAIQINTPWPSPSVLLAAKEHYRSLKIIIQLCGGAIEQAGGTARGVVDRLYRYPEGIIDTVLFDESRGKGLILDALKASEYLGAIRIALPKISLGVAGGLERRNLGCILGLARDFPGLSIDAQGHVRDEESRTGYLLEAFHLLGNS